MSAQRPHRIIVYPPQSAPMAFEAEQLIGLGVALDPTFGVVVRVRNSDGEEMTIVGLPFSIVHADSRIEVPPGQRHGGLILPGD